MQIKNNINFSNVPYGLKILFLLVVLGIAVQIGLRINRLITEEIPIIQLNSLWEKRIVAAKIVHGAHFDLSFIQIIQKIPADIAFQCKFETFLPLFQYWFYPRRIGKDDRVICSFQSQLKEIPKGYQIIYQDKNKNTIFLKDNFYHEVIANPQKRQEWAFFLEKGK